jgi:hypothetical protein
MVEVKEKSLRQRVLSFFEMKEELIKSEVPRSYLDYVRYFLFPIAFIIPYFIDNYYFFGGSISYGLFIYFLSGLVWVIILHLFLYKDDKVSENIRSSTFLDISVYQKQSILYRVLSGLVFCLTIGVITYIVFDGNYNFGFKDLVIYICIICILIISGSFAIVDENNTTKIIKIESDKWRVSYDKGEKYILLDELKQIKIARTHLSFFPKKGKVEMLKDFECDDDEQLLLKEFLEEHLVDIPVSIYVNRLEVFKDNN